MTMLRLWSSLLFAVIVAMMTSSIDSTARACHVVEQLWDRNNASGGVVDLVFVLDRSGSMPHKVWMSLKNLVKSVINRFDIGANSTRVSVISFSTSATVDVDNVGRTTGSHVTNNDRCSLYRRIDDYLDRHEPEGHAATGEALLKAYDVLLMSRPGVKKIVVLVTDGRSNIGVAPVRPAVQMRSLSWSHNFSRHWDLERMGPEVEIYAFGMATADLDELTVIASPLPDHVALLPSYASFEQFARSFNKDQREDRWLDVSNQGRCLHSDCAAFGPTARCLCGENIGQYACSCGPGYHLDGLQCRVCPKGFYQDQPAPLPCRQCPENTTTLDVGASRLSDCLPLPGFRTCSPPPPEVANAILFAVAGTRLREVASTGVECADGAIRDGNSCHYECHDGYRLTGSPVMVCESSGQWRGTVPNCIATDCHAIDEVSLSISAGVVNVTYVNGSTTYGSIVEVTCKPGTVAIGGSTWMCNRNGQWTTPVGFRCHEVHCGPLVNTESSNVITSPECLQSRVALGTECRTRCPIGFEHRGPVNFTCTYNGRTFWSQDGLASCHDVEPPTITCPPNVDVTVADWDDVSAIVHYDAEQPLVADNSGNVTWRVVIGQNESLKRVFGLGHWPLVYEAVDGENNRANCTRYVHVRAKTVELVYCPNDVTLQTNSPFRNRVVTWPDPVFVEQGNVSIAFLCTKSSGSEFAIGSTRVDCFPEQRQSASSCHFIITVTDPPCQVPNIARQPLRGSVNCSHTDHSWPGVCRVLCADGYELYNPTPKPPYRCDWRGVWNIDGPWPECYRTYRPSVAYMRNTITAKISGSCSNLKSHIIDSFIVKMTRLLSVEPEGICKIHHRCWFKNLFVNCIDTATIQRYRRHLSADEGNTTEQNVTEHNVTEVFFSERNVTHENDRRVEEEEQVEEVEEQFTVEFVIVGQLSDQSRSTVTAADQRELAINLNEIFDVVQIGIDEGQFAWTVSQYTAFALYMEPFPVEFEAAICSSGQILNDEDPDSPACHSCPVGSYYDNGSCLRCPHGFFQDQEGSTECKPCPQGQNSTFEGARNVMECKNPCQVGHFSITGYEACSACPVGSYQSEIRSSACDSCPANHSTLDVATRYPTDCIEMCGVNTYSETGLEPCSACLVGTHQPHLGSLNCLQCGSHSISTYCPENVSCSEFALSCDVNSSSCAVHSGSPTCLCYAGFTGPLCSINIDDCVGVNCLNGATCVDDVMAYKCACPEGYSGRHCEVEVDECNSSPCLNGGSCLDGVAEYSCVCAAGFSGSNCQSDIDECSSSPCGSHGQCSDLLSRFLCTCDFGFTGDLCDKEIDHCVSVNCQHGGRCIVGEYFNVSCSCLAGFTGTSCEQLIDFCESSPCLNGGKCFSAFNHYSCVCPIGFSGEDCSQYTPASFDLVFSKASITDYVIMHVRPMVMRSVTGCVWIRTGNTYNYGTVWSYAVESNWLSADDANVFTVRDYGNIQLYVNGYSAVTNVSLNNGVWQHLCVTWDGRSGDWHVYVNGTVMALGHRLAGGTYIQGGGVFVLGQEQDVIGGGFNIQESFVGEMSQFVLNDYLMNQNEINELAQPVNSSMCRHSSGTVISWTDTIRNIRGNVIVTNQSRCFDVDECNLVPPVCTAQETCVDVVGGFECRPCLTSTDDALNCSSPSSVKDADPCYSNPCRNRGTCRLELEHSYTCECAEGFGGRNCDDVNDEENVILVTCSSESCYNGGLCKEGDRPRCVCVPPWTGPRCQVTSLVSCDVGPCVNNGTCVPTTESSGFECQCPSVPLGAAPLGPNCELRRPCDQPDTCRSDAGVCHETVINQTTIVHECLCLPGFFGTRCENDVRHTTMTTTAVPSTPLTGGGYCLSVDCRNGGTCIDLSNGFRCHCQPDFKGDYCTVKRNKETHSYHVAVTLEFEYDRLLPYNETFKELFRQQVHHVYEKDIISSNSKFLTRINSISKGSVKVDFNLEHTYYLDQSYSGPEALRLILENELRNGQLGMFKASLHGFLFQTVTPLPETTHQDQGIQIALYVAIGILASFVIVGFTGFLVCFCQRYQRRHRKEGLIASGTSNPVSNPMYGTDYRAVQLQRQEQARCRRLSTQESIYCEPREVSPYATSEDSDKNSLSRDTRPPDWRIRQSMPLPPKPDDAQPASTSNGSPSTTSAAATAEALRCSPPPPYFPLRPLTGAGASASGVQPPPRIHSYVNDEDADPWYFQPIGDEEQLLGGDGRRRSARKFNAGPDVPSRTGIENEYLIGRQSPPPTRDQPVQSIEMDYLVPTSVVDSDQQAPLSSFQLDVQVIGDGTEEEDDEDIDVVDGRAVLYAIGGRPSPKDS